MGYWTTGYIAGSVADWDFNLYSSSGGLVASYDSSSSVDTEFTITTGTLSIGSIVRSSGVLGGAVELTITFTPDTDIISGNFLRVNIPEDAAVESNAASESCETSGGASITCTYDGDWLEIESPCGSSGCSGGSASSVVITSMTNPTSIPLTPTAFDFNTATDVTGSMLEIDSYTSGSDYVDSTALVAGSLSVDSVTHDGSTLVAFDSTDMEWTIVVTPTNAVTAHSTSGFRVIFPENVGFMPSSESCTPSCTY